MKRDTRAGSLPYMEAGERMRLSQARLVEARANLRAWRVAAAVWGLTAGYSKAWDAVFVDGLAELTAMDERSVRRGIKECAAAGALQWHSSSGGTHGRPSFIGLPELTGPSKPAEPSSPGHGSPVTDGAHRAAAARLPSDEVMVMSSEGPDSHGGEHPQAPIAHRSSARREVSEDWHAERRAIPQPWPAPEQEAYDWDAYDAAVDAAWWATQSKRD